MTYFMVQFPLKTEKYQEDILDKRFEIGRQIYNSLVNITQKRYKEMIKSKRYRSLISQLSGDKSKDKPIWKQISPICFRVYLEVYVHKTPTQVGVSGKTFPHKLV